MEMWFEGVNWVLLAPEDMADMYERDTEFFS